MTRRFVLRRTEDETGVSGIGDVAEGVEFTDGTTVIRWGGQARSTVVWTNPADAERIHGHGGKTRLVYLDPTHNRGDHPS